ncbi:MAG TPA: TetR/AcrR family transcriptional regulator [Streptosporangiaceae bacterium]|jgi:AcrR family transcriptional regulator
MSDAPGGTGAARARSARGGVILAAAAELFARRGFHGVSIEELGRAVGTTGPALYRHFPGKHALLSAMLLDISERLLAEGRARVAAARDPAAALDALIAWHVDFALDNPALITVHTRELANVPEPDRHEIRRLQREYAEEWVTVLAALRPGPPPRLRAAVHAAFGLINSTPYSAGELDRGALAALLTAMARAALTP